MLFAKIRGEKRTQSFSVLIRKRMVGPELGWLIRQTQASRPKIPSSKKNFRSRGMPQNNVRFCPSKRAGGGGSPSRIIY